jgi:hypothetical protein
MADVEHDHHMLGVIDLIQHPPVAAKAGAIDAGQLRAGRLAKTLKKWLTAEAPGPPPSPSYRLPDAFTAYYNNQRPHRSLSQRAAPAVAYTGRPKAASGKRTADTHDRVRTDRMDADGKVTLRHNDKLYHQWHPPLD